MCFHLEQLKPNIRNILEEGPRAITVSMCRDVARQILRFVDDGDITAPPEHVPWSKYPWLRVPSTKQSVFEADSESAPSANSLAACLTDFTNNGFHWSDLDNTESNVVEVSLIPKQLPAIVFPDKAGLLNEFSQADSGLSYINRILAKQEVGTGLSLSYLYNTY